MATKERHKVIPPGEHTKAGVKRYAAAYEISEANAWDYLAQYALNRIATLARYASGKPAKPKKARKERPLKTGPVKVKLSKEAKAMADKIHKAAK